MSKKEIKAQINDAKVFGPIVDSAFDSADKNKSGYIEKNELKAVFDEISVKFSAPFASEEEVDKQLKRLDTNKDGKISKKEFGVLVKEILYAMVESMP